MRTYNMTNNFTKHFYDPYDSLDVGWKLVIDKGYLSIAEAAILSGFSRQYLYKVLKCGAVKAQTNGIGHSVIKWRHFVKWYSSLPSTPTSPIGYASLSLSELMRYTGMSRSWVLKFASRYSIPSYYVGRHRRFCKTTCIEVWNLERIFLLENYLKTFGSVEKLLKHTRALEKQIYLQKKYLTIRETADYIAQSPNFVYNLTRNFELPFSKPGGKIIFIEVEDINKWIAKNRLMSYDEIKRNGMKRVIEMKAERDEALSSLKTKNEKKISKSKAKQVVKDY